MTTRGTKLEREVDWDGRGTHTVIVRFRGMGQNRERSDQDVPE